MSGTKARFACFFAALVCLLPLVRLLSLPSFAENALGAKPPSVSAQSAVLIEAQSGAVVYEKDADRELPMASTTKIMTALVALKLAPPEKVIKVSPLAVGTEGSSVYLEAGEELTLGQLLYALLLESANDAAVAIACGLCGSVEAFAEQMNLSAAELGLTHTHFENPHGLDADTHYTTARELAAVTREALKNEFFAKAVSTRTATIPHPATGGERYLVNHNKLLRFYSGCVGVKTGYTKRSGRCLVSAATRDGVTLIAVTLNAPSDWSDHTAMLDYGMARFESVPLCTAKEEVFPLPTVGGTDAYVLMTPTESLSVTLPVGHGKVFCVTELPRFEFAPVEAGDIRGRLVYSSDTDGDGVREQIGVVSLAAVFSVDRKTEKKTFWERVRAFFGR